MAAQFNTTLFSKNTPCLYFNVKSTQLPGDARRCQEWLSTDEPHNTDMGRITLYNTPHWIILRLIVRYLGVLLDDIGLNYSITSPTMNSLDIDAFITDPARDPKEPYMVNRKIPVQLVVQGTWDIMRFLEYEIINFTMRQCLGKTYGWAEKNHIYIKNISFIAC